MQKKHSDFVNTKLINLFVSFFICTALSFSVVDNINARWATRDDVSIESEFFNQNIVINQDGTYQSTTEQKIKILNEAGKNVLSIMRLAYNNSIENLEILEAKTINSGIEIQVPKNFIEKKPLASSGMGFDQKFQIMISFPKLSVGSSIYIKTKYTLLKNPINKYYQFFHNWSDGIYHKKTNINIRSLLPLNIAVNDPYSRINIKEDKDKQYQIINISQRKEFTEYLIMENHSSIEDDDIFTWIALSSAKDYSTPANLLAKKYNIILKEKLPKVFEIIKDKAAKIDNEVEKFNFITSELANIVSYMGDWRTINGQIIPRHLDVVASDGFGDCKDFATVTTAILRNLGYNADVALVYRGYPNLENKRIVRLPLMSNFNHAIVRVINAEGKVRYLDPTNFLSMADGVFSDIANRTTLVLGIKEATLELTDDIDYKHNVVKEKFIVTYNQDYTLGYIECSVQRNGESAQQYTGMELIKSKKEIEDLLIGIRGSNLKIKTLPNLKSRIVGDLEFQFSYTNTRDSRYSNYGPALDLIPVHFESLGKLISTIRDDQLSDIFIGNPCTLISQILIKNHKANNLHTMDYVLKTRWFNFNIEYKNTDLGIEVNSKMELLQSFIKRKDINTEEFKILKHNIQKNLQKSIIVERINENIINQDLRTQLSWRVLLYHMKVGIYNTKSFKKWEFSYKKQKCLWTTLTMEIRDTFAITT